MPQLQELEPGYDPLVEILGNYGRALGEGTKRNYRASEQNDALMQMLSAAKGAQTGEDVLQGLTSKSRGHADLIAPLYGNIMASREQDRLKRERLATRQYAADQMGVPLSSIPEDVDPKMIMDTVKATIARDKELKQIHAIAKHYGVDPKAYEDMTPAEVQSALKNTHKGTYLEKANTKAFEDIMHQGAMADDVLMDLAQLDPALEGMEQDWHISKMMAHYMPWIKSPSKAQATAETLSTQMVSHFKKLFPRMTNLDLQKVEAALPAWNKSLEANQAITKIFQRQAEFVKLKKRTAQQILQDNGGEIPADFEQQLSQQLDPIQDEIIADLRAQCDIALSQQTKAQPPKVPANSTRFKLPDGRTMTIPNEDTARIEAAKAAKLEQV